MEKKTPLYECHLEAGGKPQPFAGYLMVIQYDSILNEHRLVREKAGLFDVSHMGEVFFSGPDALANIQKLVTNNCEGMSLGRVRYSPMCNDQGGVVDDLMVHYLGGDRYLLVVNAANRHKDVAWMQERISGDVTMVDRSDELASVALQGPASVAIMDTLIDHELLPQKYYTCVENVTVGGIQCLIARTGYTGEDGFELYCENAEAPALWNLLLKAGEPFCLKPCGLGCRDTLRLEAAMPLYGHEMNDEITPLETGLGRYVDLSKADFIGKDALMAKGEPGRTRVGLKLTGRGIAREGYKVLQNGAEIGFVMSGSFCPTLEGAFATALVPVEQAAVGTVMQIDVRGRATDAVVVPLPFYSRKK